MSDMDDFIPFLKHINQMKKMGIREILSIPHLLSGGEI